MNVLRACRKQLLSLLNDWLHLQDVKRLAQCVRGVSIHRIEIPERQVLLEVL